MIEEVSMVYPDDWNEKFIIGSYFLNYIFSDNVSMVCKLQT